MSIKFLIPRHDLNTYNNYIGKSLKQLNTKSYDIFDDPGEQLSLTKKYNIGIRSAIQDGLKEDDILVCVHEDVFLEDPLFMEKVELSFEDKSVGMCGVIGCTEFQQNLGWWMHKPEYLFGHCLQQYRDGRTEHLIKGTVGFSQDIVCIDGLIMMIRGKVLLDGLRFDEKFVFDFYDISFALDLLLNTKYNIAISDILVKHRSEGLGIFNEKWETGKALMMQKYKKKGIKFPINKERIAQFKGIDLYSKKK